MGAWTFAGSRLWEMFTGQLTIRRASRPESGSPACGSTVVHNQEAARLMADLFANV